MHCRKSDAFLHAFVETPCKHSLPVRCLTKTESVGDYWPYCNILIKYLPLFSRAVSLMYDYLLKGLGHRAYMYVFVNWII